MKRAREREIKEEKVCGWLIETCDADILCCHHGLSCYLLVHLLPKTLLSSGNFNLNARHGILSFRNPLPFVRCSQVCICVSVY